MLCKDLIWLLEFLTWKCLFCALFSRFVIWQRHCLKWSEEVLLAPIAVKYCKPWAYVQPYCIASCLQSLFSLMVKLALICVKVRPLWHYCASCFLGDVCSAKVYNNISGYLYLCSQVPCGAGVLVWPLASLMGPLCCFKFLLLILLGHHQGLGSRVCFWTCWLKIRQSGYSFSESSCRWLYTFQKSEHLEFAWHEYPQWWTCRR